MKSIIDIIAEAMEDDRNANDDDIKDKTSKKLKCKCGKCSYCKKNGNKSKMCKEMMYHNKNKPCGKCSNCKSK